MTEMRVSLLVLLVPAVAFADASTPGNRAATPAKEARVLEYWIDAGATTAHCAPRTEGGCDLHPLVFDIDGQRVTVGFDASASSDYKIHVRAAGGELVLEAAGQGYLSRKGGNVSAELVANVAPVPLIKVGSHPEACADFWDVYVSVVDGVPRQALALYGVADPPAMSSSTVKLAGDTAVVTTRISEDETHTRTKRTRYRWNGSVFVESKRVSTSSK
ncbi:MAG: hypothetical protein JWM53_3606 [bacterium]|nr:hypothetical protein [bacterium]